MRLSAEIQRQQEAPDLPEIERLTVGPDWPLEILENTAGRVHRLLDEATAGYPAVILKIGDAISRRWVERWDKPHLDELRQISARIGRPGTYYFNTSYEWGCTTNAGPSPDGRSTRLMRVLDWPTRGLGRNVLAAQVVGKAGSWITLTWPGYTGVLQGMAPGRFAAALNQGPMAKPIGLLPVDWAVNRSKVWRSPHMTPAHLLRLVFETAETFEDAKRLMTETPLTGPAIYTLSGVSAHENCVIERKETEAHVIAGPACAANDWQRPGWFGHVRGDANEQRRQMIAGCTRAFDGGFEWLRPPVWNERTRLAMVADAAEGRLIAQGFETEGPATQVLSISG